MHTQSITAVTSRLRTPEARQERQAQVTARFLSMIPTHLRSAPTPVEIAAQPVEEAERPRHPISKAHHDARPSQGPASAKEAPSYPEVIEYPSYAPAPRVLASYAPEEEVRRGRRLSKGAVRLWQRLHQLALETSRAWGYRGTARQIVYHLPAISLAGLLGYHVDHVTRLARELERAGLLDCGGHVQRVKCSSLYDGTLWAVLMVPGGEPPRIRAEEWRHNWRPSFAADLEGCTGAALEMSELLRDGADEQKRYQVAKARAVNPGALGAPNPPPPSSPDNSAPTSLKAVIEGLGALWHLHPKKRARAVGLLASQIAHALSEPDRRRYWCKIIWQALKAQNEMRGGLQVLGAQLARLEADLREGAPWRNPGAVLAARLKST